MIEAAPHRSLQRKPIDHDAVEVVLTHDHPALEQAIDDAFRERLSRRPGSADRRGGGR